MAVVNANTSGKITMTRSRLFILATLLIVISQACLAQSAGGYTATNATTYSFVDISQTGASVLSGTDDGTAPLTIPFVFQFYGEPYTMVCVSSNGILYFIASSSACSGLVDFVNTDITANPTPGNLPAVMPFWMDLTFQVPGGGSVYYETLGTVGQRRFIVQWNNAYPLGSPNPVTFQLLLSEGSNAILFQYLTTTLGSGNPANNGQLATIGITSGTSANPAAVAAHATNSKENPTPKTTTGRRIIQYSYSGAVAPSKTAILFIASASTTCASDVTAQITVKRGGFTYNSGTQRFLQTLTLTNSGTAAIAAPLYLVLDDLSSNANLSNASGTTSCTSSGNPYILTSQTGSLAPAQSVTVQLQFANPTEASITYTTQILSGAGTP
jgi:hypothetical protein